MENNKIESIKLWAKTQLDLCESFWSSNAIDEVNGGIFTCLDRKGEIYSTDKSVWMQGRTAWTFAKLCNVYGEKEEWKSISKSCLDFMQSNCINAEKGGRMYFQVTKEGKPLRQRRYNFSEGFYTIANAEYYMLTNEDIYIERAKKTYDLIYDLNNNLIKDPVGMGPKGIPSTRSGRSLADPMIYLNLSCVMMDADVQNKDKYIKRAKECVEKIIKYHYKEDLNCTLENVGESGEFWPDITVGRIVNPGHVIECAWFMMDFANRTKDETTHKMALKMLDDSINIGWDKEYEGLLYFTDCLGKPTEAYEHDMKLWWPHNEMLISCAMAYRDTKDEKYLNSLELCVNYCKKYFVDEKYGEWYGYLRRDGKPTEPTTKGSTFKGPFHLPRALIMLDKICEEILDA